MRHFPVIGIAGKAGTGKDTIAQLLLELGVARYRYGFADPLRAMLKAGLHIDMDDPDWQARKERSVAHLGKSPRQLLQTLGTDWGRNLVHPDIWIKEAQYAWMEQGKGMVIPDVRFPNEAAWIRLIGGQVLHVRRFTAPLVHQHASEDGLAVLDPDWLVVNDGDLEALRGELVALFIKDSA